MSAAAADDVPLGKQSEYPPTYMPSLLRSIERAEMRTSLGIEGQLPFYGKDTWTCFEFSWLNAKGRPEARILKLEVPCNSAAIVESKSMKLYLNSYAQTVFGTPAELLATLNSDLALAFRTPAIIELMSVDHPRGIQIGSA